MIAVASLDENFSVFFVEKSSGFPKTAVIFLKGRYEPTSAQGMTTASVRSAKNPAPDSPGFNSPLLFLVPSGNRTTTLPSFNSEIARRRACLSINPLLTGKLPRWVISLLKTGMELKNPVWVLYEDEQMELTNFNEELNELINNIRGNSNYGAEMVTKVEEIF